MRLGLGGMLANICVESHLRDLVEQRFEVADVKNATAGPRHLVWGDGYRAAMINWQFLAHAVPSTDETIEHMCFRGGVTAAWRGCGSARAALRVDRRVYGLGRCTRAIRHHTTQRAPLRRSPMSGGA